jgi:quercetin dioxygenase-like cupin family protein
LRLVLVAGKKLPTHQVASLLTVQCIEGSVEFATRRSSRVMRAGTLLFLGPGEPHSVEALENSSLLITRLASGD